MSEGLELVIGKDGTLRMPTQADRAKNDLVALMDSTLSLGALKAEEEGELEEYLVKMSVPVSLEEFQSSFESIKKAFGSYEEALETINLTDKEINMINSIYLRWMEEGVDIE